MCVSVCVWVIEVWCIKIYFAFTFITCTLNTALPSGQIQNQWIIILMNFSFQTTFHTKTESIVSHSTLDSNDRGVIATLAIAADPPNMERVIYDRQALFIHFDGHTGIGLENISLRIDSHNNAYIIFIFRLHGSWTEIKKELMLYHLPVLLLCTM